MALLLKEGAAHYEAQRYFQAQTALRAALAEASGTQKEDVARLLARVTSAVGVELFNEGEFRRAEATFAEALQTADDGYAHFGLGLLRLARLEQEDARAHLERGITLEPRYARGYQVLAVLDYREGRSAEALARIAEALRLDPADRESRALAVRWEAEASLTKSFRQEREGAVVVRRDPRVPARRAREVFEDLAAARADAVEQLGLGARRPVVVVLFLEGDFHKATGSLHWVGGVFDGQIKLPVPGDEAPGARESLRRALRHELAHAAVRDLCGECPNWLNEGIAQRFEDATPAEEVRAALVKGRAQRLSFSKIPTRLWEVDDERLARWTYLEGLGFVDYLRATYSPFRIRLCLESLRAEGSVPRAFEVTFGQRLEALEEAWWASLPP